MAFGGSFNVTAVQKPDYCSSKMAAMWQLQQDGIFTDAIIKVKDKSIPCHRNVLSVACEYFATVLANDNKEGQICMEEISSDVMTHILKYLYGQSVTFPIESLSDLLDAVEILQLGDLISQLVEYMSEQCTIENALQLWKVSTKYGMDDLKSKCVKQMCSDIANIGASDGFKGLSISELLSIITDEDIELKARDELFIACIEWVDYQSLTCKDNVADIFKSIDLSKCSVKTLKTIDKKYQDIIKGENVYRIILNELFRRHPEDDDSVSEKKDMRMVIIGGLKDNYSSDNINNKCFVKTADSFQWQWEQFAEMPQQVQNNKSPIVCTDDGFIVFCGGSNKKKTTKYDAKTESWLDLPESPKALDQASAVMCDHSVYLLGGIGRLASVYRLDLASLTWHQEVDMLYGQQLVIAAAHRTNIYVMHEGNNGTSKPFRLQVFNTQTKGPWQYKSSLPQDAPTPLGSSLVAAEDALYLVDGLYKLATRYTVATDTWTMLKPPTIQHYFCSTSHFDNKIYVIGHLGHANASVYDIEKDEWSVVTVNLPFKQISFCKFAHVAWL